MEYIALLRGLLSECFSLIQYKRLPVPVRIFAIIGVFPFLLLSVFYVSAFAVWSFLYSAVFCAVEFLEKWVEQKREGLGTAAEAVLYLVTMPAVLLLRLVLALTVILLFFVWFCLEAVIFLASLGGTRWQPFLNRAAFAENNSLHATTDPTLGSVIAVLASALILLYALMMLASAFDTLFLTVCGVLDYVYTFFAAIAIPLTFKKRPANTEQPVSADTAE